MIRKLTLVLALLVFSSPAYAKMTAKEHLEYTKSLKFCELVNSELKVKKVHWKHNILQNIKLGKFLDENLNEQAKKPFDKGLKGHEGFLLSTIEKNERKRIDALQELAHLSIAQKNLCNK